MKTEANAVELTLEYSPPFDWPFLLGYLKARATPGVEAVNDDRYLRVVRFGDATGSLEVTHQAAKRRLVVTAHAGLKDHVDEISRRVSRMFDLGADMAAVHSVLLADSRLAPLVQAARGVRIPGSWSAFELIVRAIVGQQVSVKAASTIMGRIASRLGSAVEISRRGETMLAFPSPRAIADGNLDQIGMPTSRVAALQAVAQAIADESIPFSDDGTVVDGVKPALLGLRGIGPWTVEYFALRALRDADAWPGTDLVLVRSLAALAAELSDAERLALSEQWRPWRGYAAIHLWYGATRSQSQAKRTVRDSS